MINPKLLTTSILTSVILYGAVKTLSSAVVASIKAFSRAQLLFRFLKIVPTFWLEQVDQMSTNVLRLLLFPCVSLFTVVGKSVFTRSIVAKHYLNNTREKLTGKLYFAWHI